MSKPTLADIPARYQEQARAQLAAVPHPRTVAIEKDEPTPTKTGSNASKSASFIRLCESVGMSKPTLEHRFFAERRWRFDYAWPARRVALEVEGGVWTGGRHTHPSGFIKDMEKYNKATELGWCVFRCTPDKLCSAETIRMLKTAL